MEEQINRSVLVDHEIIVDGELLRERKELTVIAEEGKEKKVLHHVRSIGDREYVVKQITIEGKIVDETVDTSMNEEETVQFRTDWEAKWHPSIGAEGKSGGIGHFFKKFLK